MLLERLTMADQEPRVWLVGEHDEYYPYRFSAHAVFTAEADARAYADLVGAASDGEPRPAEVQEVPLFGPGGIPEMVEAWEAEATVAHLPNANEPPKLVHYRFPASAVPGWAKQPCELSNCDGSSSGLFIRFYGSDKDAVLEACAKRYEAGLDALGARR